MVDAGVRPDLRLATAEAARTHPDSREAFLCLTGEEAMAFYARFCREASFAPPQSPEWVCGWARHCNPDVVVLASTGNGRMALALEVVREGPNRIARFPGGSHANGNFPAIDQRQPAALTPSDRKKLAEALRRVRADVDVILLERQVPKLGELQNPLASLRSWDSPNIALAADLSQGFDSLLNRGNAKKRRKKHRYQVRKFEAAGGYRRFQAVDRSEVERLLNAFFEMKALRFARSGIKDVFAEADVKDFFLDLYVSAAAKNSEPDFVLYGLEVGGKIRAVTGCSRIRSGLICDFGAFSEDELSPHSPGEFLFYENIREASKEGLAIYDLGVGDENYKRDWCDIETTQFDVAIPLTARGRLSIGIRKATSAAKRQIKANQFAWEIVKRLRRRGSFVEKNAS